MGTKRSWEGTKLGIWVLLLVGLGFALAYRFASPAPPRTIRMVSGEEGGAYSLFASRYRGELARHGIELEILHSGGSIENLALLRGGDVDAGLVQAGVIDPEAAPGLLSLGSLFYEPLWVFVRPEIEVELLSQLRGLRLAVGSEDSGTRALAAHVLESNGVSPESAEWLALSGEEGARALAGNRVDVMFVVGSAESPLIRAFPPTYRWQVRSRIYRWYGELREVDPGAAADLSVEEVAERLAGVARIEREVAKVPTPPSYAEELYTLRLHVDFVRRRLGAIETRTAEDDPKDSRGA